MQLSQRALSRRAFVLAAPFAAGVILAGSLAGCGQSIDGDWYETSRGEYTDRHIKISGDSWELYAGSHLIASGTVELQEDGVYSFSGTGVSDVGSVKNGMLIMYGGGVYKKK